MSELRDSIRSCVVNGPEDDDDASDFVLGVLREIAASHDADGYTEEQVAIGSLAAICSRLLAHAESQDERIAYLESRLPVVP